MTTERKKLIERLRDATEGPRMLMGEAADMLEADAVPPGYGWLTACDEEMICYHLGVANLSDSYESAKRKLRALIDLNVAIATDPAVNGGMSLQPAVPQEPVAWQPIETAPKGLIVLIREPRCSGLAALYLNGWKYESGGICYLEPTHWMPLPPSPDAAPQPQRPKLTEREIDLLDGMIEIQLQHAERCDAIPNRTMAEKQKGWDMERVALLRKVRGEA